MALIVTYLRGFKWKITDEPQSARASEMAKLAVGGRLDFRRSYGHWPNMDRSH